jgi:hypothetical protein
MNKKAEMTKSRRIVCSSCIGGGEEDRTPDIQLAKLALSQLSYTPENTSK